MFIKISKILIIPLIFILFQAGSVFAASSDFSLYWSSDSFIPFEYEGKALPSQGSKITVYVAPAQKTAVDPDSLYYVWLLDDDPMGWANGAGKSSFSFTSTKRAGSYHQIESQIYDQKGGELLWRKFLSVKISEPEILVHREKEAYSNLSVSARTDEEIKLEAQPLFFNAANLKKMGFSWIIDQKETFTSLRAEPNKLNLKIPKADISEPIQKKIIISSWPTDNRLFRVWTELIIDIR